LVPTTSKKTNNKEIAEKLIQSMTCHDVTDLPLNLQTQWFELSASLVWEGLARLQIMDSVYLTQNPCIRVFESLPFPLGLRLKDGKNQRHKYQRKSGREPRGKYQRTHDAEGCLLDG
jgi:hypothetical protein